MADSLGSWIVQCIVLHDQQHGADLNKLWSGGQFCQLIQFTSYRTESHPLAQIKAVISDQTHHIRVGFDVSATDGFEQPGHGLPSESLTSHLRSIFLLKSFRFRLLPPPKVPKGVKPLPALELPQLTLEVLDWEVHSGGRDDPVFWEKTVEVGRSKDDGEVQRVLRKWWHGESNSERSQPEELRQAEAGSCKPCRRTSSPIPRTIGTTQRKGPMPLADFLEPYLNLPHGRKTKPIPDAIFEMPPEAKRALEEIQVFALELERDAEEEAQVMEVEDDVLDESLQSELPKESSLQAGHTASPLKPLSITRHSTICPTIASPTKSSNGKRVEEDDQWEVNENDDQGKEDLEADADMDQSDITDSEEDRVERGAENEISESKEGVRESADSAESEDEIPIKAFSKMQPRKSRKALFDPLGPGTPRPDASTGATTGADPPKVGQYQEVEGAEASESEADIDEDDLSDYSRKLKRAPRLAGIANLQDSLDTKVVVDNNAQYGPATDQVDHAGGAASQDTARSLEASQPEDVFSLSRYTKSDPAPAQTSRKSRSTASSNTNELVLQQAHAVFTKVLVDDSDQSRSKQDESQSLTQSHSTPQTTSGETIVPAKRRHSTGAEEETAHPAQAGDVSIEADDEQSYTDDHRRRLATSANSPPKRIKVEHHTPHGQTQASASSSKGKTSSSSGLSKYNPLNIFRASSKRSPDLKEIGSPAPTSNHVRAEEGKKGSVWSQVFSWGKEAAIPELDRGSAEEEEEPLEGFRHAKVDGDGRAVHEMSTDAASHQPPKVSQAPYIRNRPAKPEPDQNPSGTMTSQSPATSHVSQRKSAFTPTLVQPKYSPHSSPAPDVRPRHSQLSASDLLPPEAGPPPLRKLGGFTPDLGIGDGLRESWVVRMTDRARELRGRKGNGR